LQSKALFLLAFFIVDHEGVFGQSGIDKVVDVDAINGSVFDLSSFVILFKVHFEDIFWLFGLVNFQIFS